MKLTEANAGLMQNGGFCLDPIGDIFVNPQQVAWLKADDEFDCARIGANGASFLVLESVEEVQAQLAAAGVEL